jgi:dephospho-CoA kinase
MDYINGLTWPRIAALIPEEMKGDGPVALEAAVMLHAGWGGTVDRVLLLRARRELRLERLLGDGYERETSCRLMDLQDSYERMEEGADYVLDNDGDEAALIDKVRNIPEVRSCLS